MQLHLKYTTTFEGMLLQPFHGKRRLRKAKWLAQVTWPLSGRAGDQVPVAAYPSGGPFHSALLLLVVTCATSNTDPASHLPLVPHV